MADEKSTWKLTNQTVPHAVWTSVSCSAALAGILVLEIVGITAYGYYRTQRLLDPKRLGDRIETAILERYPEARAELLSQVQTQSPQIAERVSQQILKSTPSARHQLEQLTSRQLDAGLDQIAAISREQFREMLQRNHDSIVTAFERVEQAPDGAHRLVLETEASLEEQLGIDVQRQAHTALALLRNLNDKLERLQQPDAPLDSKELLERRIVRILRAVQERETPIETAASNLREQRTGPSVRRNRIEDTLLESENTSG
jgi:hypothetical protein